MFDSVTFNGLTSAMNGLTARSAAIADNVANVNTPDYTAKTVSFEDALAASVQAGSGQVTATTGYSSAARNQNGNNVDLTTETVSGIQSSTTYQFTTQAISAKFAGIRAAMRTS